VSVTSTSTTTRTGGFARRWRPRRPGRRLLAGLAVGLAVIGVVVAVTNPFAGGGSSGSSSNGSATSLATVMRQSLTSQTQVDGTLGYAGSSSVVVPAGTAVVELRQAEQTAAAARAALRAAQATLSVDEQALAGARAKLAADRLKLTSNCRGEGAAASSSGNGSGSDSGSGSGSGSDSGSSPCATAAQAVASDEASVSTAEQKVTADRGVVAADRVTLAGAEQSLAAAESSATGYDAAAAYTMLPSAGTVVRRGKALYAVDGQPVLLLYGRVPAWRAFRSGMSPGRDVAELNANLRAFGYGGGLAGDSFTATTRAAIVALQAAHGLPQTGVLVLGSVVFKPGPVRVTSVTATVGQAVQAGPVLSVSSTRHEVAIKLDAAQQAAVNVGDPVSITLPDNSTTPGRVASVGKVASSSGDGSDSGSSTPTIDVGVRLLHQAAAGQLVQAPVSVSITTASVKDALVVPVNALLALAGGGYAIEVVNAAGVHRLVPVTLGLFDDAAGLVQVSGSGVKAGQRVVVPAS
jgi:peptidoglycan hydrolase-like protein with peptidoglycan-binding domain